MARALYFFQPADVKDMTFMTYKYPAKDDDRWMFIPAINMVKRIAAQDKRSSFVGSDCTYEDVSGRDIEDDNHAVEREEKLGSRDCYVVKSTPKSADADFGHKLTWVDKANFLPLKEEQFDRKGAPYKQFSADEVADVKGRPTVVGDIGATGSEEVPPGLAHPIGCTRWRATFLPPRARPTGDGKGRAILGR